MSMNLERLRNLQVDRLLDLSEAIVISAELRSLSEEYDNLEIEAPEWIAQSTDVIREEIARRTRADAIAELKRMESELDSLKTAGERRAELQKSMGALQKRLGLSKAATSSRS